MPINRETKWQSEVTGGTKQRTIDISKPAVDFEGVGFSYPPAPRHHCDMRAHKMIDRGVNAMQDITLQVPRGARIVLVGENGAGKSTLLETVRGQHKPTKIRSQVLGLDCFEDTVLNGHVTFVGAPWAPEVSWGSSVESHLSLEGDVDPEHVNAVMRALHVDPRWRIDRISAGQKRRVQLLLGFLRRRELLCLDECSTDIDVVERHSLLDFFRSQSEAHGVTVLYATHIFDGLDGWATHVARMVGGRMVLQEALSGSMERGVLYRRALGWIRDDKVARGDALGVQDAEAVNENDAMDIDVAQSDPDAPPPLRRGEPAIQLRGLNYAFPKRQGGQLVLQNATCDIPAGARVLMVGTNGSGKSTLLRILSGRHLIPDGCALIHGREAFGDTKLMDTVAFSGDWWAKAPDCDMSVRELLNEPSAPRTRRLLTVFNVDLDWDLKRVSAGQARRIQLLLSLERRRRVLLLDEVTSDMDVVQREKFLRFLISESQEEDPVTVIYCTHIFEGLDGWPTHIAVVDPRNKSVTVSEWDKAVDTLPYVHRILNVCKEAEWKDLQAALDERRRSIQAAA